jgi:starch synthase
MCLGAIPIGSSVGGIKDTVIDLNSDPENATGLLVPPRDAFALARAMVLAKELDDATLRKLRENGKKRARKDFTWENACRRYMKVYEGAVDKAVPFLR